MDGNTGPECLGRERVPQPVQLDVLDTEPVAVAVESTGDRVGRGRETVRQGQHEAGVQPSGPQEIPVRVLYGAELPKETPRVGRNGDGAAAGGGLR